LIPRTNPFYGAIPLELFVFSRLSFSFRVFVIQYNKQNYFIMFFFARNMSYLLSPIAYSHLFFMPHSRDAPTQF